MDTIHNVRQGVWATDEARRAFENREDYKQIKLDKDGNVVLNKKGKAQTEDKYHADSRFRKRALDDKEKRLNGDLFDEYRGVQARASEKTQLDHVISSSEIHHDAGRILAKQDGVALSLNESNLISTHAYINNKKSDMTMEEFVQKIPNMIKLKEDAIKKKRERLEKIPNDTAEHRHQRRVIEQDIEKDEGHIKALKSCDTEAMLQADKKARQEYNQAINKAYYSSSKFWKNTGAAATSQGFRMGVRQAVGLVLAEVWFELKEAVPTIIKKCRADFQFETFWGELKITLTNIFERVKLRFKDMLTAFKDGFIGGILSSITTVFLNVFFTTGKLLGRLIRESWNNLVQAIKLVVFNPENLAFGDLMRELTRIILASVSTIAGVALNQHLNTVLTIPFGTEISSFISALLTGLLVMGTGYFLDYNQTMQKLWAKLNAWNLQDEIKQTLQQVQAANAELDRFAAELAKLEFGLNPHEFEDLIYSLNQSSSEIEKSYVLKKEVARRNIELPFEMGNSTSTVSWLKSLEVKS